MLRDGLRVLISLSSDRLGKEEVMEIMSQHFFIWRDSKTIQGIFAGL